MARVLTPEERTRRAVLVLYRREKAKRDRREQRRVAKALEEARAELAAYEKSRTRPGRGKRGQRLALPILVGKRAEHHPGRSISA